MEGIHSQRLHCSLTKSRNGGLQVLRAAAGPGAKAGVDGGIWPDDSPAIAASTMHKPCMALILPAANSTKLIITLLEVFPLGCFVPTREGLGTLDLRDRPARILNGALLSDSTR